MKNTSIDTVSSASESYPNNPLEIILKEHVEARPRLPRSLARSINLAFKAFAFCVTLKACVLTKKYLGLAGINLKMEFPTSFFSSLMCSSLIYLVGLRDVKL